jgi:hypothetical protein
MKILRWVAIGLLALLALIQFIPPVVAWQTNPPVVQEPNWDRPQTYAFAERACFDCHSNQTDWTWYSKIAPMSWLVTSHVLEGREELNFSEWNTTAEETEEIIEVIQVGSSHQPTYFPLHPEAQLSPVEQQQFIEGMRATLAASPGGEDGESGESGEGGEGGEGSEMEEMEEEEEEFEE